MSNHRAQLLAKAVTAPAKLTVQEFYNMLLEHDWFAGFSDSFEVTRLAEENLSRLKVISEKSDSFKALIRGFHDHHFSGDTFGKPKVPIPAVPQTELFVEINAPIIDGSRVLMRRFDVEVGGDVWQDTSSIEPPFLLSEIEGRERLLGVFTSYRDVWNAACFSVCHDKGGYSSVVIENVELFKTFEQFAFE